MQPSGDRLTKAEFSFFTCRAFLKKNAKQVSDEAVEEFQRIMEEIAFGISKKAFLFADDEDRLKVTMEDVKDAKREYFFESCQ